MIPSRARRCLAAAALALAGSAFAATDAAAIRNHYTHENNAGFFKLLYGSGEDETDSFAYERPIRRSFRTPRDTDRRRFEGVPPPPFVERGD